MNSRTHALPRRSALNDGSEIMNRIQRDFQRRAFNLFVIERSQAALNLVLVMTFHHSSTSKSPLRDCIFEFIDDNSTRAGPDSDETPRIPLVVGRT